MRICSRCNAEVKKTDITCHRCGFSLLRDKYGKRVDYKVNKYSKNNIRPLSKINTNKTTSPNNAVPVVVAIFVLTFVCSIIPLIITTFYMNKRNISEGINTADIDLISDYTEDVIRIASDYEMAWRLYSEDNTITLDDIVKEITLDIDDMTNDSCINYSKYGNEKDLLTCVYRAYEDIDIYTKVNQDVTDLYNYVDAFIEGDVRDNLIEVYGYTYELYYLPESIDTYQEYKKKYDEYTDGLNEILNNILQDKNL